MAHRTHALLFLSSALVFASCDGDTAPVAPLPTGLSVESVAPPVDGAPVASQVVLAVRVLDGDGRGAPGVPVRWSADDGRIASEADAVTDATGVASALWELGTVAGPQQARARVESGDGPLTVAFSLDGRAGGATRASLGADSVLLSARRETVFLAPDLRDTWGNVTSAGSVIWRSSDPGVVDVAPDGLVTAAGYGEAWVVPAVDGTATDSIRVTVVPRGAITVSFDDAYRSAFENAIPAMNELGLRGNVGVYTEAIGWPDFMTEPQLQLLHESGWSMASHTVSHDTLPNLDAAALDYELRESRAWLDARGFRGTHVFIAPYHEYEDRERANTARYYMAARGESANRVSPDSLVAWRPDNPFQLTGIDAEALPYTTEAGRERLRALLQRVTDEGAFLDLYFHRVPAESAAHARATLEVVAEFRDRVLPYHELFPVFARTVR